METKTKTETKIEIEATASWGSLAQYKETEEGKRERNPGLISVVRYNLCALICNSITQATNQSVGQL